MTSWIRIRIYPDGRNCGGCKVRSTVVAITQDGSPKAIHRCPAFNETLAADDDGPLRCSQCIDAEEAERMMLW